MTVLPFPVTPQRHTQIIKAREMYAQGQMPEPMVWDMCSRMEGRQLQPCMECPRFEKDEFYIAPGDEVQRMCFGLAHEACQIAAAWIKRQATQEDSL